MVEYSTDTSDPRWKEFAMNEQKTSRDLLIFALMLTTIVNLLLLSVISVSQYVCRATIARRVRAFN